MRKFAKLSAILLWLCILFYCSNFIQAEELTYPFSGMVNEDKVNIRSDSTITSAAVCTINKGQYVEVTAGLYDWYRIRLPEYAQAFINKNLVNLIDEKTAVVVKDNVNIRSGPDTKYPILGKVHTNDRLAVLGEQKDWYRIIPAKSCSAWINKKFINRISDEKYTAKTQTRTSNVSRDPTVAESSRVCEQKNTVTVTGVIKSKFFTATATHKLVGDDRQTYLLKGDSDTLNNFLNLRVRITAKPDGSAGRNSILTIEKVELAD